LDLIRATGGLPIPSMARYSVWLQRLMNGAVTFTAAQRSLVDLGVGSTVGTGLQPYVYPQMKLSSLGLDMIDGLRHPFKLFTMWGKASNTQTDGIMPLGVTLSGVKTLHIPTPNDHAMQIENWYVPQHTRTARHCTALHQWTDLVFASPFLADRRNVDTIVGALETGAGRSAVSPAATAAPLPRFVGRLPSLLPHMCHFKIPSTTFVPFVCVRLVCVLSLSSHRSRISPADRRPLIRPFALFRFAFGLQNNSTAADFNT
jgi:hypothetical protein